MKKIEFEKRRKEQIQKLMENSTPKEKRRIRKAQREGRKWRKELEALEQNE